MAIHKLRTPGVNPKKARAIKEAIRAEIRRPAHQPTPKDAPLIFAEAGSFPRTMHYYVVWDRFRDLDIEVRDQLVFEAIREELGDAEALKTLLAKGLTWQEAGNAGIQIETSA